MNTILKDFLNSEIFPQMKKLGFRKCGGYFYRQNEHFAYTIHIEKPACAVYQDEFIIGAGIFSFDIADIMGYNSDRRIIKDLHGEIEAFREANIKGISFSAIGTLRFSKH